MSNPSGNTTTGTASSAAPNANTATGDNTNTPLTTPIGGVGGLGGAAPPQQQSAAKPVAGSQKGVASTGTVVPPTESDMKIDPYEAANAATAAFKNERKMREDLQAQLDTFKKAQQEQEAAMQAAKKANDEKAEEEKKRAFLARKQQVAAALNHAFEQMMAESGGTVSPADVNGAKAPLMAMTDTATTAADLDAVQKNIGPVIEFAMKACAGARGIEERNKQRELAANMQALNSALASPPPSNLAISGGYGTFQPPQMQQQSAVPAETTTHKASNNFFDNYAAASNTSQHRTPLHGPSGVASTPAKADASTAAPVDLNKPGWGMQLIEEFQTHSPGWLPSEQYLRHGGIERVERIVNSNGQQHIQKIPQARRPVHAYKGRLSMKDIAPVEFDELVKGINEGLRHDKRPAFKDIAAMHTDEDYRKAIVPYKPEATDEGVTML